MSLPNNASATANWWNGLDTKLLAVGEGNLDRVGTKIIELEIADQACPRVLAMMHQEFAEKQLATTSLQEEEINRIAQLEGHLSNICLARFDGAG